MAHSKHLDSASAATVAVTFVLFVVAVFVHGLTQHLLLEAAVFLVSLKLILMSYKNAVTSARLEERLAKIENMLSDPGNRS